MGRLVQALEVLAGEGSEQAAALLAQINGPEARLVATLLDKAVPADLLEYFARQEHAHQAAGANDEETR